MSEKEEDCPDNLIKYAHTDFEKAVVIEFVEVETKMKETFAQIKNELKWLKWLSVTVFVAIVLTRLI